MAGILVSPGLDNAVRRRSSYKRKGGSPSFKEILRNRCKERIKARRCSLLNQFRHLKSQEDVKEIIHSMVREEAMVLSSGHDNILPDSEDMNIDIQPLENITLNNFEEWLLNEYDRLMEEQIEEDVATQDQIVCPLCLKSPLMDQDSLCSSCKYCQVRLPLLNDLTAPLDSAYNNHFATKCQELPSCTVIENSLYLFCTSCSFIVHITDLAN